MTASWLHLPLCDTCERLLNNSAFRLTFVPSKSSRREPEEGRRKGRKEGRRDGGGQTEDKIHNTCSDRGAAPLVQDAEQRRAGEFDLERFDCFGFHVRSVIPY